MCGTTNHEQYSDHDGPFGYNFVCGAYWTTMAGGWEFSCQHAMTACLRVGATLTPSPAEQARERLVAMAAEWKVARQSGVNLANAENRLAGAVDVLNVLVRP